MKSFTIRIFTIFALGCLFLTSCKNKVYYSQFSSIPSGNWHMDSIAHFDYFIDDTTCAYKMTLYVRHTDSYPYQNIWLFVGDSTSRDSLNIALADNRGVWYGESHNGFMEMPIVFGENIHFADTGSYHLMIQHGMRDTFLRGVTEVGLEISK